MYIHESLKNENRIERKGIIKDVLLPKEKLLSADITIIVSTEQIEFRDGESIFVVDKEIGVIEDLYTTIFIAGDYLICEVLKGTIYIKDKGKIYTITDSGTRKISKVREEDIKWVNVKDYVGYISPLIGARYNLNDVTEIKSYIDNLSIDIKMKMESTIAEMGGVPEELKLFTLKMVQDYKNFGLDKFEYVVKEKKVANDQCIDAVDTYEIWRKEKEREKREKKAIRKAEQEYQRIKNGEDIIDYDIEGLKKNKKAKIEDFDMDLDMEDELDEYIEDGVEEEI